MDTVFVPVTTYPGWARGVATAVTEIESSTDAEAVVAHLFDAAEVDSMHATHDVPDDEEPPLDALAEGTPAVAATLEELEEAGIDSRVRGVCSEGDRGTAIVEAADREGANRIYLYGRKRSPTGKAVFGSTLQQVLLAASCPVVVHPFGAQ